MRPSLFKRVLKSPVFLIFTVIILLLLAGAFFRAFWQDYQIRQEIKQLEDTKAQWEQKKLQLLDYLQEVKSDDYAEREARLKFGMVKPGEKVVVLSNGSVTEAKLSEVSPSAGSALKNNPSRWWAYFFKH